MRLFIVKDLMHDTVCLDEPQSMHIVRVLRMKVGDQLYLTNGQGLMCEAVIVGLEKKHCEAKIIVRQENYNLRNYHLHLAICPTKGNDRMDWLLEKITEIGVDEISILISEHSERKQFNHERAIRIIESAVKQSIESVIPTLHSIRSVKTFVSEQKDNKAIKGIAHCNSDFSRITIKQVLEKQQKQLIMIGPEGDFSSHEISLSQACGFTGLILSNERLRTETAAITTVAYTHFVNL